MKVAQTPDGRILPASPQAPPKAACPNCGGPVMLRSRRTMDGGRAYFWRHLDNKNSHCAGRARPVQ